MKNTFVSAAGFTVSCLIVLGGAGVFSTGSVAAQFPREGIAGIANGKAAPFKGKWWVGFPEGEGMINGAPLVECTAPVELVAEADNRLLYRSPKGVEARFELTEFSGRTTLYPENGESVIAVWISPDEFLTYSVDLATGRARWDSPLAYRRCEG